MSLSETVLFSLSLTIRLLPWWGLLRLSEQGRVLDNQTRNFPHLEEKLRILKTGLL